MHALQIVQLGTCYVADFSINISSEHILKSRAVPDVRNWGSILKRNAKINSSTPSAQVTTITPHALIKSYAASIVKYLT